MSIVFVTIPTPQRVRTDTWRSKWPAEELARRGHDAYYMGPEGETATTGWAHHDTVIIHASNQDVGLSGTVRYLKRICRGVFVSFDDDYRSLPLIQDVTDRRPLAARGHLGELGWFGQLKMDLRLACSMADGVIASTPECLNAYADWITGGRWVIRNYLPSWVTEIPVRRLDPPVVGWFGDLAAHQRDLEWLGSAARDLRRFGVVGDPAAVEKVTGRTLDHRRGMVSWSKLYRELGRFSVGIVPVVLDAFNRPKSWIKPVEFAAVGVPSVCSWLPAYEEAASNGLPMSMGLPLDFAATPEVMVKTANDLLDRTTHRDRDHLRSVVRERFTMETAGGDAWEAWVGDTDAS